MIQKIENNQYTVTMEDSSDGQWIDIEDKRTNKEIVFVYTCGTIKVDQKEVPRAHSKCVTCGRDFE
jgi:hypothetical protein